MPCIIDPIFKKLTADARDSKMKNHALSSLSQSFGHFPFSTCYNLFAFLELNNYFAETLIISLSTYTV